MKYNLQLLKDNNLECNWNTLYVGRQLGLISHSVVTKFALEIIEYSECFDNELILELTWDLSEYIVNKDKMLRLGTIVSVKGKEHRYMIISRLIRNNDNELFDYYGCLYPEGNLTDDDKILFNDDEINNIYFNGYENEQEVERNKELVKYKSIIEKNQ